MIPVSDGHASEGNTLGPIIETDERLGPRWTAREARQIFLLEFQEAWARPLSAAIGSKLPNPGINTAIWSPIPARRHARRFVSSETDRPADVRG